MSSALLVTDFSWVGISTPVINTAGYLIDNGWDVKILAIGADFNRFPLSKKICEKIEIINIKRTKSPLADGIKSYILLKDISKKVSVVFFFDMKAILLALTLPIKAYRSLIYYSLEFFEPQGWKHRLLKKLECVAAKKCNSIITQDEVRARYLKADLNVNFVHVVPNSRRGPFQGPKLQRARLGAPNTERPMKLLFIGTLGYETCLDKVLDWYEKYSPPINLIVHGWFVNSSLEKRSRLIEKKSQGGVLISTDLVDDDKKSEIYTKADVVFVGFCGQSKNLQLAAGAAGKLYDAMCYGRPVLALRTPGMTDIVTANNIGRVVDDLADTVHALGWIRSHYSDLSENLRRAHIKYSHDWHLSRVVS